MDTISRSNITPCNGRLENVSVVIPTRNRACNVEKLLNAILNQTTNPKEIIIVDDSEGAETESLVHEIKTAFLRRNILLKYARGKEKNRSISAARNIGVEHANGSIIFFIDDDVMPDKHHIEQILNCYRRYPDALAVQGYVSYFGQVDFFSNPRSIFPNLRSFLLNAIKKVFLLPCMEKGKQTVLRSGHITFPYMLTEESNCSWICGTISSYRREVLRFFKFDEKLRGYSLWEDVDVSFRINRSHPNSLYITPFAKAIHEKSPLARRPARLLTYTMVAYHTYFFFKNMPQTLLNRVAFLWSLLGMFYLRLLFRNLQNLILLAKAYHYTLEHLNEVISGRFTFLN